MKKLHALSAVLILTVSGLAQAAKTTTQAGYPVSEVERPLILPGGMTQLALLPRLLFVPGTTFTAGPISITSGSSTLFGLGAAVDYGFGDNMQFGIFGDYQLSSPSNFNGVTANFQYGLSENANVRIDAGILHGGSTNFIAGVGVPLKYKIGNGLAFASGRPFSYDFADDIFRINTGTPTMIMLHAPLGLVFDPAENVSLFLQTGYQMTLVSSTSTSSFPTAVEIQFTPMSNLDLAAEFAVPGSTSNGAGFLDNKMLNFFLKYRL